MEETNSKTEVVDGVDFDCLSVKVEFFEYIMKNIYNF